MKLWVGVQLRQPIRAVAFTPKGGCPLKLEILTERLNRSDTVAFTPKGGCPLKPRLHEIDEQAVIE